MPKEKTHEEDMGYDQLTPALLPEIEQLVKVTVLLPWFKYATPPHCKNAQKRKRTEEEKKK